MLNIKNIFGAIVLGLATSVFSSSMVFAGNNTKIEAGIPGGSDVRISKKSYSWILVMETEGGVSWR